MKRARCVALMFGLLFGIPGFCGAMTAEEEYSQFEKKVTAELNGQNPEAAQWFVKANELRDAEDYVGAEEQYRKVRDMAPGFSTATRRLASCVMQNGKRTEAIGLYREALKTEESVENVGALAHGLSETVGGIAPLPAELNEAQTLAKKALQMDRSDITTALYACEIALRADDLDLLIQGTARLKQHAPEEISTHYFATLVALAGNYYGEARQELEIARKLGLDDQAYQALKKEIDTSEPWYSKYGLPAVEIALGWLVGFGVLLFAGWLLSRLTLRSVGNAGAGATGSGSDVDRMLRKTYGIVLWLCSLYYYISLPIIVVTVLGTAAGLIYIFFAIGRIPIKLLVIVVVLAGVTIWSMLKSLFVRVKDEDPGKRLVLKENPKLVEALREVAYRVRTRPVDNVYLVPGVTVAVMERGGMAKQLRGQAERCLLLGVGALEGFKIGDFKAVLAHEYGHLINRDTAGGQFALAVRRSLLTMAEHLAQSGAAAWYNPAWVFLNGFYRIFLRISQGASRLQEILADRWAAIAYGSHHFEQGLRHVIEREIRFNMRVNGTINEVVETKTKLINLYSYQPAKIEVVDVPSEVDKAIHSEPSSYDSHPRPADRFAWTRSLNAAGQGSGTNSEEEVWTLFSNREAVEMLMTDEVREILRESHGLELH